MENYACTFAVGKMIVSGTKIELKKYSIPLRCDKRQHSVARHETKSSGQKREDNLSRARASVRQRVWANVTPHSKFLTLTTSDTVLDVKVFKRRMQTFFQAMKRDGYVLRYLYVLERQKERGEKEGNEGSIHAHIVVFNDEYIPFDVINKHWNGTTDIHMLNGLREENGEKVRDVGAYICKYITKESNLEWGSRCFNCSVGLNKPVSVSKTIYGTEDGQYFPNDESTENQLIDELEKLMDTTYQNAKIIQIDRGVDIINQIIDYKQGNLKDCLIGESEQDNFTLFDECEYYS